MYLTLSLTDVCGVIHHGRTTYYYALKIHLGENCQNDKKKNKIEASQSFTFDQSFLGYGL